MRKCPQCNQVYSDDDIFCVNDGTTLVTAHSPAVPNRVVIPVGGDQPTQVVASPPLTPPSNRVSPAQPSRGLYVVIGLLVVVILGMGVGLYIMQNRTAITAQDNSGSKNENKLSPSPSATPVPTTANLKPEAANVNFDTGRNIAVNNPKPAISNRFSQTYEGTVNYDEIEMQLVRNGGTISGKVIPKNRDIDISVSGNIDNDGSFVMTEYSDLGAITGVYRGRIQDDTINGTWSKPDGSKSRPLFLRAK